MPQGRKPCGYPGGGEGTPHTEGVCTAWALITLSAALAAVPVPKDKSEKSEELESPGAVPPQWGGRGGRALRLRYEWIWLCSPAGQR